MQPLLVNFRISIHYLISFCYDYRNLSQATMRTSGASNWPDQDPYSELSERQQEILQYLWNCPSPYSPSLREIGNAVGLTAPGAVRSQIDDLERRGWVPRHPSRPRALEVRERDGRL